MDDDNSSPLPAEAPVEHTDSPILKIVASTTSEIHSKATKALDLISLKLESNVMDAPENAKMLLGYLKQNDVSTLLANSKTEIMAKLNSGEVTKNDFFASIAKVANERIGQEGDSNHPTGKLLLAHLKKFSTGERKFDATELNNLVQEMEFNSHEVSAIFENLVLTSNTVLDAYESLQKKEQFKGAVRLKNRATSLFKVSGEERRASVDSMSSMVKNLNKAKAGEDKTLTAIKGLELGEAVKARLVANFELQAEARGGIDGLVFTAFNKVNKQQAELKHRLETDFSVDEVVGQLQAQSEGLKAQFGDMDQHIRKNTGELITPEIMAKFALGEVTSDELLAPIAKIASELSTGERKFDVTVLNDLVQGMNSDEASAIGDNLLLKGDFVLDAYEDLQKKEYFKGALDAVRSAGLSEESVMSSLENLDVNSLVSTTERAFSSEEERLALFSSATDSALDFVLRVLPSLPVPSLQGCKDGTIYSFHNLSLRGFQVNKKFVSVSIAGVLATGQTEDEEFKSGNSSKSKSSSRSRSRSIGRNGSLDEKVNVQEILVLKIGNISATLEDVLWNIEQTFFPHYKGCGHADAKCLGADIVMKFELRKRKEDTKSSEGLSEYSPVLCLHEHSCSISEVKVKMRGDSLSWLLNILSSLFKGLLKDYVVATVLESIENSSGTLLETLNNVLRPHWPIIMKMAKLKIDDLKVMSSSAIVDKSKICKDIELVFKESVPLGLQLLLNDKVDANTVKIVKFSKGGQAFRVAEIAGFDPDAFQGASILSVNGNLYKMHKKSKSKSIFDQTLSDLRAPGRPKAILFRLSEKEGFRIANLVRN